MYFHRFCKAIDTTREIVMVKCDYSHCIQSISLLEQYCIVNGCLIVELTAEVDDCRVDYDVAL